MTTSDAPTYSYSMEDDICSDADRVVETIEKLLVLGIVPRSVQIGTARVDVGSYTSQESVDGKLPKSKAKNFYELDAERRGVR